MKEVRKRLMIAQPCLMCDTGYYVYGNRDEVGCFDCGDLVPTEMSKPEILEHLMRQRTTLTCGHHPWMMAVNDHEPDGWCIECRRNELEKEWEKCLDTYPKD